MFMNIWVHSNLGITMQGTELMEENDRLKKEV